MTTLAGAAFVGAAATVMFAAPASATTATVTGEADCGDNGEYTISWTITSDYPSVELTISDVKVTPNGPLSEDLNGKKIKGLPASVTVTQAVAGTTTKAELSFHPTWGNGHIVDRYSGSVTMDGQCKATEQGGPAPEQPPAQQPPAQEQPPAQQPPAKAAPAPALPVTGAQAGLYAGGAAVLVAAGAGLFVVARRRRVTFEA
ncbi:hypothetical protein HC030_03585 [Planosporangium mesophilum]|nr:hypothetical protein [Planosporangium mesophilum]